MNRLSILKISLLCGLIASLLISMVGFSEVCNEMQSNIIRIRILANSDSAEDQKLKLCVRDAILNESQTLFSGVNTYDDAVEVAEVELDEFLSIAERTVRDNGYDYPVTLNFRDEYFDTRHYDTFTLPAGEYKTAVFTIGEGKGQNWWCVIFPRVCVGACSDSLDKTLSDKAVDTARDSQKYVFRFKSLELFERIKNIFKF